MSGADGRAADVLDGGDGRPAEPGPEGSTRADGILPGSHRGDPWSRWFRIQYRLIGYADPLVRRWLALARLGDTAELVIVGRRSRRPRPVLVGLLEVGGRWYVGHPNGPVHWTRNLEAAGRATVRWPGRPPVEVVAVPLGPGAEREAAIRATFIQHPFPGNAIYRLAGAHVRAVGAFYRLEPSEALVEDGPAGS
jgi:hypothetical protein